MAKQQKTKRNKKVFFRGIFCVLIVNMLILSALTACEIRETKTEITKTENIKTEEIEEKDIKTENIKTNQMHEEEFTEPLVEEDVTDSLIEEDAYIPIKEEVQTLESELINDEVICVENIDSNQETEHIIPTDKDITEEVTQRSAENDNESHEKEEILDASVNTDSETELVEEYVGTVYLTFDDGPSKDITPQILDILKEKNVQATFFVIGYSESKAEIIKRMVAEGHTIGFHGMSHDYAEIYQSVDATMENFYNIENLVKETTDGYTSKCIRFPGGSSNTVSKKYCEGVMSETAKRATEEGYVYFDWNVDSQDAGGAKTAEEIYDNVVKGIKPGRNNIVLMHDANNKENTVMALEKIIDYCIENNYCLKPIDLNTKPAQHKISN